LRPTMAELQSELLAISYQQAPVVALHAAG
jgi:hypothetical protein